MANEQADVPVLKINEMSYRPDELSDDARVQLEGVQLADEEIKRLNIQLALAQTARNAYIDALTRTQVRRTLH